MSELFKVFVYGTLKKGYANHYLMQNGTNGVVNFVTAGLTKESFPLVVGTDASIPFLLPLKGQGKVKHFIVMICTLQRRPLLKCSAYFLWEFNLQSYLFS